MLVSQVPATIVYTLLKTALLILVGKVIESICSWIRRYDVAKVMEQGTLVVFSNLIFTRNLRSIVSPVTVTLLLVVIATEIAVNLLPTIATTLMPFHLASFTFGEDQYFYHPYASPMQSTRIPTVNYNSSNPMQAYCEPMGLCTHDGVYEGDVLRISPTMSVTPVSYEYDGPGKFVTDFVNISTPYCLYQDQQCDKVKMMFGVSEDGTEPVNMSAPGLQTDVLVVTNPIDESDSGGVTLSDALRLHVEYQNSTGERVSEIVDTWATMRMLYRPASMDVISVTHLSSILYTDKQTTVVLVLKAALHNLNPNGPVSSANNASTNINLLKSVFNNSEALYNTTVTYNDTWAAIMGFTSYVNDPYLSVDLVQRTARQETEAVLKIRLLFGVFVITEPMLEEEIDKRYYSQGYLTNYNATRSESTSLLPDNFIMRQPGFYDPMFDGFNDAPTDDLFMYAVLDSSQYTMFGTEGYQNVVADISPVFLGVVCGVILAACIVYAVSSYSRDALYFATLYQTVGHIDDNGNVSNVNDSIPHMVVKNGKVFAGDKVLLLDDKPSAFEPEGHDSD